MNSNEFRKTLETLARSWTDCDYQTVISFFAENVQYIDPLRYSFDNSADLFNFFVQDEGKEQKCILHHAIFDENQQVGVFEYTYEGTYRYHGVALIKIDNEKITH